jgi:hypothetical protein
LCIDGPIRDSRGQHEQRGKEPSQIMGKRMSINNHFLVCFNASPGCIDNYLKGSQSSQRGYPRIDPFRVPQV